MAKITWLGEGTSKENPGPSVTTWQNMTFEKGEPVEITDEAIVTKAKGNRFFKVEGDEHEDVPIKRGPGRPPNVRHDDL